jgi:hypothetical protein
MSLTQHLAAVALTLLLYLFLAVSFRGWGRLAARLLGLRPAGPDAAIPSIWFGWAFTLLLFQVLHLFLPMRAAVVLPVLAAGVLFCRPRPFSGWRRRAGRLFASPRALALVMAGIAVAAWVSSRAMMPPRNYDSGLYHFNSIRWIDTYPIVPGLGNLHDRLAFNQSFFVYAAALDFTPLFGNGRALANSFLLLLLAAGCASSLYGAGRDRAAGSKTHPGAYLPELFTLPVLGYLALTSNGLASPTPDLASAIVQLAMFIMFLRLVGARPGGGDLDEHAAALLMFLAATAVTIKLSNLGYAATMAGLVIFHAWRAGGRRLAPLARMIALPSLLLVVWMARSVILSGAPFFPSTFGYMRLEWSMPRGQIINARNWVYSGARRPVFGTVFVHWREVIGNWGWLPDWLKNIRKNVVEVIFPLAAAALSAVLALAARWRRRRKTGSHARAGEWIILLPPLAGLGFWFLTAPRVRFAGAQFYLLAMAGAIVLLSSLSGLLSRRAYLAALASVFLLDNGHFLLDGYARRHQLLAVSTSGWQRVMRVPLREYLTLDGQAVFSPVQGDQCWDSPLPSSPRPMPRLRLRVPGDLASGFITEGKAPPGGKKRGGKPRDLGGQAIP